MMFGSVVVLAYLGAVANEITCNQWKRKGIHTDVYFYECHVGPEANFLHSPLRISSRVSLNIGLCSLQLNTSVHFTSEQ
jgi:hypothetical protein